MAVRHTEIWAEGLDIAVERAVVERVGVGRVVEGGDGTTGVVSVTGTLGGVFTIVFGFGGVTVRVALGATRVRDGRWVSAEARSAR